MRRHQRLQLELQVEQPEVRPQDAALIRRWHVGGTYGQVGVADQFSVSLIDT